MPNVKYGQAIRLRLVPIARRLGQTSGRSVATDSNSNSLRYKWTILGGQTNSIVRYGHLIILRHFVETDFHLTGARGGGNSSVNMRPDQLDNTYQWRLLSNPLNAGSGPVSYGEVFYLQNAFRDDRYLTGGRGGGNRSVATRDLFREGQAKLQYYQWRFESA